MWLIIRQIRRCKAPEPSFSWLTSAERASTHNAADTISRSLARLRVDDDASSSHSVTKDPSIVMADAKGAYADIRNFGHLFAR